MSISVGGLVSGLDTNSIIEQLMEVNQRPITMLQQQEAAYQVELTAYGSLKGELSSFKSALPRIIARPNRVSRSSTSRENPSVPSHRRASSSRHLSRQSSNSGLSFTKKSRSSECRCR